MLVDKGKLDMQVEESVREVSLHCQCVSGICPVFDTAQLEGVYCWLGTLASTRAGPVEIVAPERSVAAATIRG